MAHVLTEDEAWSIISMCNEYFSALSHDHTNRRHRTEVVAEAMERDGRFELATQAMAIHNVLRSFQKGDFKEISYLDDVDAINTFVSNAKGTKFEEAAKGIAKWLDEFESLVKKHKDENCEIDWFGSSEVFALAKKKYSPQTLTMIEKLDSWQRDKSKDRTPDF